MINHIHFIPAGDINTASSRLRVFCLAESLNNLSVTTSIGQEVPISAEVVIIQKLVTVEILDQADQAKSRGVLVVYDVDDSGNALWYWTPPRLLHKMISMANVITVDTPLRADWLRRSSPDLRIFVCPNMIDYGAKHPVYLEPLDRSSLRILWFGSVSTFGTFSRYAEALSLLPDVTIVVCGAGKEAIKSSQVDLKFEVIPWSRDTFVSVLQSCDLSCLMHDGSPDDRRKSNHKMISSICWGIPAIVSNTPEYRRTAIEAGVGNAVFNTPEELLLTVERFRGATERRRYLTNAQAIVWEKYSPEQIAKRFVSMLAEASQLASNAPPAARHKTNRFIHSIAYMRWRWHLEDDRYALTKNWIKGLSWTSLKS